MNGSDLSRVVRTRRHSLGLTQDDTAVLAGISRRTLSEFENDLGTRGISVRNLLAICEVLGLTLEIRPRTGRNDLS